MKRSDVHDGTAGVAVARKNVSHLLDVDAVNAAFRAGTKDLLVPVEGAAQQLLPCEGKNGDVRTPCAGQRRALNRISRHFQFSCDF